MGLTNPTRVRRGRAHISAPREPRQPWPLYRGVVEGAEAGTEADGPVGGVGGMSGGISPGG
jgi:hypothetical protein